MIYTAIWFTQRYDLHSDMIYIGIWFTQRYVVHFKTVWSVSGKLTFHLHKSKNIGVFQLCTIIVFFQAFAIWWQNRTFIYIHLSIPPIKTKANKEQQPTTPDKGFPCNYCLSTDNYTYHNIEKDNKNVAYSVHQNRLETLQ